MIQERLVRRVIALGLPVFALWFIWNIVVSPIYNAYRTVDQDIEARRFLLGKYAGVLTRVGYSQEKAKDVVSKLDRTELLEAAPDAVMAASLQSRMAELARQGGLQTHTMQVLPARNASGIKWVGLGVTLTGTLENIANVFAMIEGAKPYLFIERLTLNAQGPSGAGLELPLTLVADFEIYGAVFQEKAP